MPLASAVRSFEFMHLPHVVAMAAIAVVAVGLCVVVRNLRGPGLARGIAWAIAAAVLLNELVCWVWALNMVSVQEFARRYLPLHICGAAVFLTAVVLIIRSQFLYEIVYFWALGGTVQAIVTPDLTAAFPGYRFFQYFTSHGCVVVGVVFATWGMGMRPGKGSVWRVYFFTVACTAAVGAIDWLLDANYMFLCEPAGGASPFFFLPWPWYIAVIAGVGLGVFWLLYLPFAIRRRQSRQHC